MDTIVATKFRSVSEGRTAMDRVNFYGYSAAVVASWCLVSPRTAAAWKAGVSAPSRQALALFELHRDGRVLGGDWTGWSVSRGCVVDPDGNVTSQIQLRGYAHILACVSDVARRLRQVFGDGVAERMFGTIPTVLGCQVCEASVLEVDVSAVASAPEGPSSDHGFDQRSGLSSLYKKP